MQNQGYGTEQSHQVKIQEATNKFCFVDEPDLQFRVGKLGSRNGSNIVNGNIRPVDTKIMLLPVFQNPPLMDT
jgi:hypothetical protein